MQAEGRPSAEGMEKIRIETTVSQGKNRRMVARSRGHEIVMDVCKERGGDNAGPSPPECLTMALGGCILNICRVLAMQKKMAPWDFRLTVTGEIDPSKAFGMETDARSGFSNLSVQVALPPKLPEEERKEFCRELFERCPLCDTIGNPTPLQISVS